MAHQYHPSGAPTAVLFGPHEGCSPASRHRSVRDGRRGNGRCCYRRLVSVGVVGMGCRAGSCTGPRLLSGAVQRALCGFQSPGDIAHLRFLPAVAQGSGSCFALAYWRCAGQSYSRCRAHRGGLYSHLRSRGGSHRGPACRCGYGGSPIRMVCGSHSSRYPRRPHRGPAGHRDTCQSGCHPRDAWGETRTGCSLHGLGLRCRGDRRVWPSVRPDYANGSSRCGHCYWVRQSPPLCRHASGLLCGRHDGDRRLGVCCGCEWWCGWYRGVCFGGCGFKGC